MGRKEETKFATDVILKHLRETLSPVDWDDEESPAQGLQADIYGETERSIILIELEITREDPLENVGKTIYEINSRNLSDRKIKQIQVFSEFYRVTTPHKMRRQNTAIMIGEHFSEQINNYEYHNLELETTPSRKSDKHLPDRPEPESERREHAIRVANRIPQILI